MSAAEFQKYHQKTIQARDSKYGSVPRKDANGTKFRSGVELRYNQKLELLQHIGEVVKIDREVPFSLIVNNVFICTYVLDFRVTYSDGRIEHIDTKSKPTLTPLFKAKQALMLACYGINVVAVFEDEEK